MDLMLDDRRTERLADDRLGIRLRDRLFSMDLQIRLQQAGLSRTLARLYAARGVEPEHIHYPVTSLTHYRSMKGIMEAANLLADAILAQDNICISGDYDVDGCCATSILCDGLRQLGVDASYVIPDRVTEGYGLSPPLVDRIPESTQMIITVDNGIAAHAGVLAAKKRGMKVVVTDHHLAGDTLLPDANAIVNPNQPGCGFPDKDTCGAGVAWYLLVATRAVLKEREHADLAGRLSIGSLLDMVAFATIADVVPLGYNNRILVNAGLNRIRAGKTRAGIRALAVVAGVSLDHITAQDFGFLLGPRINAAGRLEDMRTGVRLLLTHDMDEAEHLALELHQTNQRRRNIESDMRAEAEEMVGDSRAMDTDGLPNVLCLHGDTWHEGVVGLVAGRLKEKWHRPALAFAPGSAAPDGVAPSGGILKGSARSVPGLHIRDVLAEVDASHPGLILRFGGHAMAAGLTIKRESFEDFRMALTGVVNRKITPEMLDSTILTDGEMTPDDCTLDTARELDAHGVWGNAFPEPLFSGSFIVVKSAVMSGGHWRLHLTMDGSSTPVVGVRFLRGEDKENQVPPPSPGERISGSYTLKVNRWQGKETLQIVLQDIC